ncbi:hypothetical protein AZI87_04845 [Bdellovibrio bacteriovorus]|uniref:histidine kinase n=1 Tax=Bdellovibrio bacteriovorus TaxID=959 RepID=A0A162GNJ6_BDEBC|nr:response regulator [Bdellovibrio bacteriovorus]KYG68572.1 hypothetical protein AZI87_04845 [Bdellovibrio bacteriovorus]
MEKTKLLIVDDHHENILFLSHLISGEDIQVLSAKSAEEALSLLMNHDFALALMDVQMPGMSGFELARLVRALKKTRHLPMILMTSRQQDRSVLFEGYDTGAVDFLFKPLDPHAVRSKVRTFVLLDQQRRLLNKQVQEMEFLKKKAEEANVAKSHFLANISHEIRTPLGAVLGFADILSQDKLSDSERNEFLAVIRRNGELLLRLIDDILDLTKIEAQRLEFEKKEFSLKDLLKDVEASLGFRATEKGISLKIQSCDRNLTFVSDPLRIKQILFNVIGNAIKFTTKGQVDVQVRVEDAILERESCEARRVTFTVRDTGAGLTVDEVQKLFKPFAQADVSTARRFGGTGLGLVISQQLAQKLGGDLKLISSEVQVGSVFEITLVLDTVEGAPQVRTPVVSHSDIASHSLEDKVILIVDDVSDNRLLIDRYLRPHKVRLLQAGSGVEALETVCESHVDLILMDIQMPLMDGYEAVQRIRKLGYEGPIVALTAHAMREETMRCIKAGFDAVLTKPTRRQELVAVIQSWLSEEPLGHQSRQPELLQ